MTKEKARKRAKANALKKARRRLASKEQPEEPAHPGQFDPGDTSVKGPGTSANVENFGRANRGAARSG